MNSARLPFAAAVLLGPVVSSPTGNLCTGNFGFAGIACLGRFSSDGSTTCFRSTREFRLRGRRLNSEQPAAAPALSAGVFHGYARFGVRDRNTVWG
jgi:hypothetical protein